MLSGEGSSVSKTTGMLAQKQPSLKECVTAHRSRDVAPKINGAKAQNRSHGLEKAVGERSQLVEAVPEGAVDD